MASTLSKPFTEHPASVGESYFEHFKVAMGFSKCLAGAAGAAFVHALVPSLCQKTASGKICELHEKMTTGARAANAPTAVPATSGSVSSVSSVSAA